MANVIRLLFWTWLIASTVVLVIRVSNRKRGATAPVVDGRISTMSALLGRSPAAGEVEADLHRPKLLDDLPGPAAPSDLDAAESPPEAPPTTATPPTAVPEAAPRPTEASHDATGSARSGLFAPSGSAGAGPPARTIAEALAGMAWPCGLAPVIDLSTQHIADREVAFATTDAPPSEVGAQLADGLESLGYEVASLSDTTAEAVRGDATVRIRLHPRAGGAERGGAPLFPTLPHDAVVTVLSLSPSGDR